MKRTIATLIVSAGLLTATPYQFLDPYPGNSCANDATCDVIGSLGSFDLHSVRFDLTEGWFEFNTNWYDGKVNTSTDRFIPYSLSGHQTAVADILFWAGPLQFGIALSNHDPAVFGLGSAVKGGLYEITGVLLSDTFWAPSHPSTYREGQPVWLNTQGATLLAQPASFDVRRGGPAEFQAFIQYDTSQAGYQAFRKQLELSGFQVSAASANCANDILYGHADPTAVPEPSTFALLGGGLIVFGLRRSFFR